MRDDAATRIRAFAASSVAPARLPVGAGRLVAVGWATVETERAVAELAAGLGTDASAFVAGRASAALGAVCVVAEAILPGALSLVVLEPSTEGRVAAGLARWDEGPLVAWYAGPPTASALAAPAAGPAPGDRAAGSPGPLGPERLVRGDPLTGPHRLLVGTRTGTIDT
jgi:hypothetical protein